MKYTIEGFNQKAAMNITAEKDGKTLKLDCTDLIILRFFVDFYPNMTKKIIDGKEYAWVNYQHILDDMPLLNIGKKMLSERFSLQIVASGGVSSLDDVKRLSAMNLYGAIIGKAYYTGAIDLAEAIEVTKL